MSLGVEERSEYLRDRYLLLYEQQEVVEASLEMGEGRTRDGRGREV
jgi:hypothetical protein